MGDGANRSHCQDEEQWCLRPRAVQSPEGRQSRFAHISLLAQAGRSPKVSSTTCATTVAASSQRIGAFGRVRHPAATSTALVREPLVRAKLVEGRTARSLTVPPLWSPLVGSSRLQALSQGAVV